MNMLHALSLLALLLTGQVTQIVQFQIVSAKAVDKAEGKNEQLGITGSWNAAPEVKGVLLSVKANLEQNESVSSEQFVLKYRTGGAEQTRRCMAFGTEASATKEPTLTFTTGPGSEVVWKVPSKGTYYLRLLFINLPKDVAEVQLLSKEKQVGSSRLN